MKRREFITLLGGAAASWPLVARAQQPAMPVVGFSVRNSSSAAAPWTAAFVERLRELGWIEGRTVAIQIGMAEGRTDRARRVRGGIRPAPGECHCDGTAKPNLVAAKQATSRIPIVFTIAGDPIGSGFIANRQRDQAEPHRSVASGN